MKRVFLASLGLLSLALSPAYAGTILPGRLISISVGPDNSTRILTGYLFGEFGVSTVTSSGTTPVGSLMEPIAGWTPEAIATGPNNDSVIGFVNSNNVDYAFNQLNSADSFNGISFLAPIRSEPSSLLTMTGMTMDAQDNVWIAGEQQDASGSGREQLYVNEYTDNGSAMPGSGLGAEQVSSGVAVTPNGTSLLLAYGFTGGGDDNVMDVINVFTPVPQVLASALPIHYGGTSNFWVPFAVTSTKNGDYQIVWRAFDGANYHMSVWNVANGIATSSPDFTTGSLDPGAAAACDSGGDNCVRVVTLTNSGTKGELWTIDPVAGQIVSSITFNN